MPSRRRLTALALLIPVVVAAFLAATAGGSGSAASGSGNSARAAYFDHVRDAVVQGTGRDFAEGTGIGGPEFAACVEGLLGEALDPSTITDLAAVYRRPGGSASAAQVLNAIASPLAARCGHRAWVPELIEAAHGLSATRPTGAAARLLGVTYGPFLGLRCSHPVAKADCERIGIDIVFRRAATRVVAVAGDQRIELRTPGEHDGVRRHDWVGAFTESGIAPGSYENGVNVIRVPIELRVIFAGGRHAHALFPQALLAPGWG
jgi:hypothetical protein